MTESALLCARGLLLAEGLAGIDLNLEANTRVGILGAAKSGKTQLLRTLAHLDSPQGGKIFWNRVEVSRRPRWTLGRMRTFVTMILSNPYTTLEPWATVESVLNLRRESSQRVDACFRQMNLSPAIKTQRIGALSGVQRVLLSLTRALLHDPHVLLVDDVFAMLVPEAWPVVVDKLCQIAGPERAVVIAGHCEAVMRNLDSVLVLRDGEVIASGPPAEVLGRSRSMAQEAICAP